MFFGRRIGRGILDVWEEKNTSVRVLIGLVSLVESVDAFAWGHVFEC